MLKNRHYLQTILATALVTFAAYPAQPADTDSCQKCLIDATQLLSDGDAVKASEIMQALSSQCTNNAQFQTLLATIFLRLSNAEGSEKAALKAIEIAPNSIPAHFQYALALKKLGKKEAAVIEFDKVVELDPGNWESWASLSDLYKQLHQDDKAKQCEYKAATLAAPTLDARNSFFRNLIHQKKLAKAEEEFTKAINSNEQNPVVLQQMANQALSFNFWSPAILASELVLKTFPNSQEALISKATGEYFLHKYADCQNSLRVIFKTSPDNSEAKVLSALCLIDLGQITEAAELLETANAPKDNSPLSVLAIGKWHQSRGDFKAAEASFGSIADEAVLPEAQLCLARLYIKQGRLDDALEKATFNAGSKMTLSRQQATQAEALYLSSTDKARQLVSKALSNSQNEPYAILAMAKIELAADKRQECQTLANDVIGQMPGCSEAYLVLAQTNIAEGRSKEAEKQLDKVLSLANDDPDASLLLGKLYLQDGNSKGAIDSLKAALAGRQESPEICYVLAKALEQAGDRGASLKYYKQSISLGLVGADNTAATQAIKRLTSKSQE